MKPAMTWKPSPNFTPATDRPISCIVLHATATKFLASPLEWLTSEVSKVSAHYLIDLDGTIYNLVLDKDIAWHAGVSSWRGKSSVNMFSIGIEMVNPNDGSPYPEEQYKSCKALVEYLLDQYPIVPRDVVSHAEAAPGRKTDPAGFDMEKFRKNLEA